MNLFRIADSLNLKEIGKYPRGVAGGRMGNILHGHDGYFGPVVIENPLLPIIPIHKKATLTDYIGGDNVKIFISPQFYMFLISFLSEHQIWNMQLSNDVYRFDRKKVEYVIKEGSIQELYDYKILHISYPSNFIINHSKSEYFLDDRDNYYRMVGDYKGEIPQSYMQDATHQSVKIKTDEDYQLLNEKLKNDKENNRIIIPKKLVFDISKLDTDIFRIITPINNLSGYYVTEKLKNKIEEKGFTGMDFKPLSEINPHVAVDFI